MYALCMQGTNRTIRNYTQLTEVMNVKQSFQVFIFCKDGKTLLISSLTSGSRKRENTWLKDEQT